MSVRDTGPISLKGLVGGRVTVGIHAEEGGAQHPSEGGETVAEIASLHELGAPKLNIPERSFVRAWVDENEPRARQVLAQLLQRNYPNTERAYQQFALWAEADVKARIDRGLTPANSEFTIAQKGSDKPLIDQGILKASIKGKVE